MADILYGEPSYNATLEIDLEAGRIVLGGCVLTNNDPTWQCADGGVQIYKQT